MSKMFTVGIIDLPPWLPNSPSELVMSQSRAYEEFSLILPGSPQELGNDVSGPQNPFFL